MTINDVDYALYNGQSSHDVAVRLHLVHPRGNFPMNANQKDDFRPGAVDGPSTTLSGARPCLRGSCRSFSRTRESTSTSSAITSCKGMQSGGNATELRLSGTAWNGYWRYGGTILNDPLANANVSILYSLGDSIRFPGPAQPDAGAGAPGRTQCLGTNDLKRINSARVFYRFSF